jgi:hemerythrin superfamily protein
MTNLLSRMSPSITNMIRLDHAHVESTFRQFESAASPRLKKGLVDNACLALEIHAQLEEEIFYPALREVADTEALRKAGPEHNEMRQLIGRLRAMGPGDLTYDETFMELARVVMHHVAEEETQLLPAAERLMPERLQEMGARMTRRRLELAAPRTGELAGSMVRSMSMGTMLAAGSAMLAGAYLLTRNRHTSRPLAQKMWTR